MDDSTVDPHSEIERLEESIEQLSAKLENCRKLALAARIAIALGGALLIAIVFGAIIANSTAMTGAVAAVLGGIVLLGSNASTAQNTADQLAAAEARRAELIGTIELRQVDEPRTLH